MGYTHNFKKKEIKHDDKTWNAFLTEVKKVAYRFDLCIPNSIKFIKDEDNLSQRDIHIKIGDGMGEGSAPEFNENHIWFNGVGEDSHETLAIDKDDSYKFAGDGRRVSYYKDMWEKEGTIAGFTKTARKPYDVLVTATLVLYKHHFKDKVEVYGGDGREGFQEGLDLVNQTLGTSIQMEDVYTNDKE